ncbi:MAG: ABC transporter permease [Bacteroidota bacterium]
MSTQPPKHILLFLRWFCHPEYVEDIEGDLLERFDKRPSRWRFTIEVLKLLRPSLIKPWSGWKRLNAYGMLKHNILISIRGFRRNKTVFGINMIGLVASLTCFLFCLLWVKDELRKDRFHQDTDKVFQVFSRFENSGGVTVDPGVSSLLKDQISLQISAVKQATVTTDVFQYTLSAEGKAFRANGRFSDATYLNIFDFPLLEGDPHALSDPSTILITQTLANRLFGRNNVIGEMVEWRLLNKIKLFQVAGILEDISNQSSEQFDFILPWEFYQEELITSNGWGNFYGRVMIKLSDADNKLLVENKINEIFESNQAEENVSLFLKNYADKYLYGKYEDGKQAGGRIDYVYLVSIIAGFVLLIACINFVNLSTAFSALKIKEIGVKKSFGASRTSLTIQFFSEYVLLAFFATLAAVLFAALLMEPFTAVTGKQFDPLLFSQSVALTALLIPVIGCLAGLYPALYLSGLKVITALRKKTSDQSTKGSISRKTLVFIQFSLSILLLVGTLIVGLQMDYALTKNLGYDRDNLLYFQREGKVRENSSAFIAELERIPGVKMVSQSGFSVQPGYQNRTAGLEWPGKAEDQNVSFWENSGDSKSAAILGLELVAGRLFDDNAHNEENSIILNETAVNRMGIKEPIGMRVDYRSAKKQVIGVVRDFTTESLHNPIEPTIFHYRPQFANYILAKIERGKELETISKIEALYSSFNPNYPFDPQFIDQDYRAMYEDEIKIAQLSKVFSVLAIVISSMGLFGLTIFQIQRRVKEVGIKKILGAETWKLAVGMTFDFTKSVFLALAVAIPLSYFLSKMWLENFADAITLSWWIFGFTAFLAVLISWLTVGFLTYKAANVNPVLSLKSE